MEDAKKYTKINFLVAFASFFLCIFLSISYAALTTSLNIDGEVSIKSPDNIRLIDIQMTNTTNGGIENYNPLFYLEEFVTSVNLPALNSTVTYTVSLKNAAAKNYMITAINEASFSNANMEYTITSLSVGDVINSGTTNQTFTITFKYKATVLVLPGNITLNAMIDLDWQEAYYANYDSYGGSVCNPTNKIVANTLTYGTLCTTTRTNYRFAGWYTGAKGTGTQVLDTDTVSLSSDITLYARWIYEQELLVGNFPQLKSGMIPVVYDDVTHLWKKADIHEAWYDYNAFNWANIVTTSATNRTTLLNASAGTTVPIADINTMFVWIPRYSYAIKTTYGEGGTGTTNPGYIMVKYVSDTTDETGTVFYATTPAAGNWRTHPAFWWDQNNDNVKQTSEYLNGLWVGKFETAPTTACTAGTTVNAACDVITLDPAIKPNLAAWRGVRPSTAYLTINNNMNGATGNTKYGLPNDTTYNTHMMKNSEWGAVAYLSQSLYGKYGNTNYATVALKEVYINNSSGYFTGRSGGRPGYASGYTVTAGCFDYDGYIRTNNVACNPTGNFSGTVGQYLTGSNLYLAYGASTTGTIYGVYGMSGGANEIMMTDYYNATTAPYNYSGNSATANTGFNGTYATGGALTTGRAWPEFRFYDRYTTTTLATSCSGAICYGHSLSSEVPSWYSDTNTVTLTTGYVSYLRGGAPTGVAAAGVFRSDRSYGTQTSVIGFRTSLVVLD